jgi:hypothetical protein
MNLSKNILVLIAISCLGFAGLYPSPVQAQETPKGLDTIKAVRLSPARLRAFEGVYQHSQNKELYVQFRVLRDSLIAKLLWADQEIPTVPKSDSSFLGMQSGDGGHIPFVFIRDKQGAFTNVSVGNSGLWVFVKDYKPVVKKEIEHTPGQLKPFEGLFGYGREQWHVFAIDRKGEQTDSPAILGWQGNCFCTRFGDAFFL